MGHVRTTSSTVTFHADALSFSAVYLQPSMSREDVAAALGSVAASHVVLGDVNTRLPWLQTQLGRSGPPERVAALSDFARSHGLATLEASELDALPQSGVPTEPVLRKFLTVDHCFVKSGRLAGARLFLLDNQSMGLPTDHAYTLCLHLSAHRSTSVSPACPRDAPAAVRFHLGKLSDENIQREMCAAFDQGMRSLGLLSAAPFEAATLERRLISLVQSICRRLLGQKISSAAAGVNRKTVPASRQDPQVSTLLYKSAAAESRENGDILPSERGRSAGLSALQEISDSLEKRYAGRALVSDGWVDGVGVDQRHDELSVVSESHVVSEIRRQDASKACGLDGVHMRVIKALLLSSYPKVLCRLFNLCLSSGRTPASWNSTDVHMVTKDTNRPRDVDNVRPITLICMHRKLFERLLLVHFFDKSGWAKLHPTQAGFRGDYSALTNAVVVHHLLSTGLVRYAAFIDLEKAFDMVDHTRLRALLVRRGCPVGVRDLIENLTFRGLRSRVLVNGQSSDWFPRTRGVLQGSPLSPYLFNIYIDELVVRLNASAAGIPQSLFYADDGVLLAQDLPSLRRLADLLTEWSAEAGIAVNVKKCGLVLGRTVALEHASDPVLICGKPLPVVEYYTYLGFPVGSDGIDFAAYLSKRISQANGRASFLRLHSDSWGPAHRLRVYGRYLAPMFEYGAPLIFAWSCQSEANKKAFRQATVGWKDLIGWILDCSPDGYAIGANLCGILEPETRFRHLHTSFQRLLSLAHADSPLNSCLASRPFMPRAPVGRPFLDSLRDAPGWTSISLQARPRSCSRGLLRLHLRRSRRFEVMLSCRSRHLTRLTAHSRSTTSLYGADCVFFAPLEHQQNFVRYRMGRFQLGKLCACGPNVVFRRGHEDCRYLPRLPHLSGTERRQKIGMAKRLGIGISGSFTDLDFLLNTKQYLRAGRALAAIRAALGAVYSERMEPADDSAAVKSTGRSDTSGPRDLTPSYGTN